MLFLDLLGPCISRNTCLHETPRAFLNSFDPLQDGSLDHKTWLEAVRHTVWERVQFEDEMPPSWDGLWRHWLRSCWVSDMWNQATQNQCSLLRLSQYGWIVSGDNPAD